MSLWLHGHAAVAAAMNANTSLLDPENMTCVELVNAFSGGERCKVVQTVRQHATRAHAHTASRMLNLSE